MANGKYFKLNKNENITSKNLWDATEQCLEKF